jgi:hypothetical protein
MDRKNIYSHYKKMLLLYSFAIGSLFQKISIEEGLMSKFVYPGLCNTLIWIPTSLGFWGAGLTKLFYSGVNYFLCM